MNKVKTSLLAAAAGVLISPALMAADVNSQTIKFGWADEALGLAGATDVVTSGDLVIVLNAEYTTGDLLNFTFSGGALDPDSVPTSATTLCNAGGANSGVTLGLLSATADAAQFRVTEISTDAGVGATCANSTVGLAITIADAGDLKFDPDAVDAANGVTVGYSATTATNQPIDTGSGPVIPECESNCNSRMTAYIQTGAYFGVMVDDRFNATIDVNQDRKVLLDPDGDPCCSIPDEGGFSATLNMFTGTQAQVVVGFVEHTVTFSGNFGWIVDISPDEGIQAGPGVVNIDGDCGLSDDWEITAATITATCGNPFATLSLDPSVNDGGSQVLSATSFSASTVVAYEDIWFLNDAEGAATVPGIGLGAWDLNGYQALIPYMPYGNNISQIIYLANRGSQTGLVTVDWIDANGNSGQLIDITSIAANSTKSLGNIIKNALPAAQRGAGRLALVITANIPSEDGQLNAQYNVSGNRAYVLHEDNRGVVLRDGELDDIFNGF